MSGLDFCLFLSPCQSSFLQNISVCCQAFFFPSHGPCWHKNPSLLTWGRVGQVGGHYYSWGSVIHSVTRCQHEVSVCTTAPLTLYQPGVANEKHQVNTTSRTAMALNLLIHLDIANWNPCELHSGHHPFSYKPLLKGKMCMWFDRFCFLFFFFLVGDGRMNSPWPFSLLSLCLFCFFEQSLALQMIAIKSCREMSQDKHNQIIYLEPAVTCNTKNNQLWVVKNVLVQLKRAKTAAMTKTRQPPGCGRV